MRVIRKILQCDFIFYMHITKICEYNETLYYIMYDFNVFSYNIYNTIKRQHTTKKI